ncbi:mannitol dehydrogenase family protein [Arsenicicoccus piscis]|uniref:Mannitol-1-phosphate 5-dehydrogenase n=1 Tax=Arsenicicoccus piscis TaxID=673954 RepID=A0ABQ6HQQ0_9MICO|nr:mannitol dehydrogenase family protein [Arsenicicoccus piscis]MCH8629253.1 mannitol dehydrogenase family protein [Arsenicicoccus piscis]GMA19789.1 mannitol 2-dehydrogenase [Arsenicicoccus piscis]
MSDTNDTAKKPVELSEANLDAIESPVVVPGYDRATVTDRIVHFGVGGFFRSHQAMYLDALKAQGLADGWAITGVATLPHDRRIYDTMTAQDGLYTLVVKHPDGHRDAQVIGSMTGVLFAPDDPQAVIDALVDDATKIVGLTITEGGYCFHPVTGEFNPEDASIKADLEPGATPTSAFGFIVAALAARRAAGKDPFTVQSSDNIPGNGDVAKKMVSAFAEVNNPELAEWIRAEVAFPNSMVDRITPVTTDEDRASLTEEFGVVDGWPVVCEPFTQWVIEDHFPQGRPAWEKVGAQMVEDVIPYELMKLRLLNASHQALAYLGYLSGYRYAHEVCSDPLFVTFLLGYMEQEGSPTLPEVPGMDLDQYRHQLIERFANPSVRDHLARLCLESSDRIPKWLVPVINENLASGGEIDRSALVVASWARYAEGVDEQGEPIEVQDRLKEQVMAAAAKQGDDPLAFLQQRDLFGDLVDDERFTTVYLKALSSLHDQGSRATLEEWGK